jgi:hypothetical protein
MIESTSAQQPIPIAPTHDGDRIYVVLTGGMVDGIDAGDAFLFPVAAVDGQCDTSMTVWGSSSIPTGTSSITLRGSASGYALVFSGLSSNPTIVTGGTDDWAHGSGGVARAPALPAAAGDVMLAAVSTCGVGTPEPVASSSFVALPPVAGADVAYAIMDGPGSGPSWQVGDAVWGTYSLVLF